MNALAERIPRPLPGLAAAAAAFALLAWPGLLHAAVALELVAAAFWWWSRLGDDRREQLARWRWLRRPAMALWLATALSFALPAGPAIPDAPPDATPAGVTSATNAPELTAPPAPSERDPLAPLRALEALAVLWAALELLGALPASRPYPDLTGPLPAAGAWLPAVLPAAGFLVLWQLAPVWMSAPWLREVAEVALLLAALLAILRAYTRRSWTASLRWLAVFDSALAGLLVAFDLVPREVAFLLWFAAAGGRLMGLAAEVRGAAARRGLLLATLWRAAGWTAGASLAWPLVLGTTFANARFHPFSLVVLGAPVFLAARLSLRRLVEAPERRSPSRRDPARAFSTIAALASLLLGPAALALAWWAGHEATFPGAIVALLPSLLGAWPAPPPRGGEPGHAVLRASIRAGASARDFALSVFRSVTSVERRFGALLGGLLRALGAPLRDLHTGDAQEYLLLLVGVGVLALLMPLLR